MTCNNINGIRCEITRICLLIQKQMVNNPPSLFQEITYITLKCDNFIFISELFRIHPFFIIFVIVFHAIVNYQAQHIQDISIV